MPELPEVETIRRGLEPTMAGKRVRALHIRDPRLTQPVPNSSVEERITGQRIATLDRRGKYLLVRFASGDVAVHHLRMTGSFSKAKSLDEAFADKHVRAAYVLTGGVVIAYKDLRRFGTLAVLSEQETEEYLGKRLGPEPLGPEFNRDVLAAALKRRSAPIKAVLLDQKVVAGLGNIYVDEALYQARILPTRPADTVRPQAVTKLAEAIVDRLQVAVDAEGSSLRDYTTVEGRKGGMQERFRVFRKGGKPCENCGRPLASGRVAGRGTTWCVRCQR